MVIFLILNVIVNILDLRFPVGKTAITFLPFKLAREKSLLIDKNGGTSFQLFNCF